MIFRIYEELTDTYFTLNGQWEELRDTINSLPGCNYVEVISNGKTVYRFYVENLG